MQLRLAAGLACALLLSGCAGTSYAPGRSAADFPAQITAIKLDRLVSTLPPAKRPNNDTIVVKQPEGEIGPPGDPTPSDETRAILAVFHREMLAEFQRRGIRILDTDAAPADLRIQVVIDYTPEFGLYVHRSIVADMYVANRQGQELRHERYVDANMWFGLVSSLVQSRDDMVAVAARKLVEQAVTEFAKRVRTTQEAPLSVALR